MNHEYGSDIKKYLTDEFFGKPIHTKLVDEIKQSLDSYFKTLEPAKEPPRDIVRLERDTVVINAEKWSEYMWPEMDKKTRAKKMFEYQYGTNDGWSDFDFSSNGDLLAKYNQPIDYIALEINLSGEEVR